MALPSLTSLKLRAVLCPSRFFTVPLTLALLAVQTVYRQTVEEAYTHVVAQLFEVEEGAEVDVRRVVPGVREELRDRHLAFARQVPAAAPVAEVGEGDDALAADAKHFFQQLVRVLHGLQCLGHNHDVEAVAGEVAEAFVQVLFDDVDALE